MLRNNQRIPLDRQQEARSIDFPNILPLTATTTSLEYVIVFSFFLAECIQMLRNLSNSFYLKMLVPHSDSSIKIMFIFTSFRACELKIAEFGEIWLNNKIDTFFA